MRGATGQWRMGYRRRLRAAWAPELRRLLRDGRERGKTWEEIAAEFRRAAKQAVASELPNIESGKHGGNVLMAEHVPRVAREVVEDLLREEGIGRA